MKQNNSFTFCRTPRTTVASVTVMEYYLCTFTVFGMGLECCRISLGGSAMYL